MKAKESNAYITYNKLINRDLSVYFNNKIMAQILS